MYRSVVYPTASSTHFGQVIYVVYRDIIVFSGITKPGSTINFVEEIVQNIIAQEQCDIGKYRWFDLQTHKGYGSFSPGTYVFQEVRVRTDNKGTIPLGRPVVSNSSGTPSVSAGDWRPAECPGDILFLFKEHIGGEKPERRIEI